jgi:hypothetical protein
MGVQLREKLLDGEQIERKHQSLIPIVAGPKVALAEGIGQSQLSGLFPIPENAEFGFSRIYLAPTDYCALPASARDPVIAKNRFSIPTPFLARFDEGTPQQGLHHLQC